MLDSWKPKSSGPQVLPPPFPLLPLSEGCEVSCFQSHSHAPEGLLIPISDYGTQSLIVYSCPPVNNKTKQNKKMIEIDKRWEKNKKGTKSKVSLPRHHCCPPPYDDSHQNHNCLHCCHFLILTPEVFNFQIDLFQGRLSFRQRREGEKRRLFSLNL